MSPFLQALDDLMQATQENDEAAVVVVVDHPKYGRGGFVRVPLGAEPPMATLGTAGVIALRASELQQEEVFSAIGMLLFDPDPAQA